MNTKADIEELTRKAMAGDANAQNSLGCAYHNADGVERDYVKAREWYEKSAAQGNYYAQHNLGVLYRYGYGVEKSLETAFKWYLKSAEQGYDIAEETVGIFYDFGYGVSKDYSKAAEWYRKAAEKGAKLAQNNLGSLYENGLGVDVNYSLAFIWYSKAANQNQAVAQRNLGSLYERGKGVKQNYKLAAYWYDKSAKLGNDSAKKNLSSLLDKYDEHLDHRILETPSFRDNPFRVLGIYTNASARDIAANRSRMDAFLRIGKTLELPTDKMVSSLYKPLFDVEVDGYEDKCPTEYTDLQSLLGLYKNIREKEQCLMDVASLQRLYEYKCKQLYAIQRTKEGVENALSAINQPLDKLKFAFFWFIKLTPTDTIALNHYMAGESDKANENLEEQDNVSSLINRGVSAFMEDDDNLFVKNITKVIHEDDLRLEFVKAICGETFQITEEELAHLFIDTLFSELPDVDWKSVFYSSGYSSEDDDYVSETLAQEPIALLTKAIEESSAVSRSKGVQRYKQATSLMALAKEQFPILEELLGKDAFKYQQIADKTARELLSCSIDYYNDCGGYDYSATAQTLELNRYAHSIAVGTTLKERTKECLNQIQAKYDALPPESVFRLFSQIRLKIDKFSQEPDLIQYSHKLLAVTFPLLSEIKDELGKDNKAYLSISTSVASNALINIIGEINKAFDDFDKSYRATQEINPKSYQSSQSLLKSKMDTLISALKRGWQEFLNMDQMDLELVFKNERYLPNRNTIQQHLSNFHISPYSVLRTLNYVSEKDVFNAATSLARLKDYLQKYPNGRYVKLAKEKIEKLIQEDDEFWKRCSSKGDLDGYLRLYSNGEHAKEAKAEIEKRTRLEDENYWAACSKSKDYKLYLQRYPQGLHSKEAQEIVKKKESRNSIVIVFLFIAAIIGTIIAIGGAKGVVVIFYILAFFSFCGAGSKGDEGCGLRLLALVLAAILGAIGYGISVWFNVNF